MIGSASYIDIDGYTGSGTWDVGTKSRGNYTFTMQAMSDEGSEDIIESSILSYDVSVLSEGEISISSTFNPSQLIDSDTNLSIPYKVTSKDTSLLLMKGKLFSVNGQSEVLFKSTDGNGIQTTTGVTAYWFVGKLPTGTYRYEMKSYTLDSQKESITVAQGTFSVTAANITREQPTQANLIAWFDANDMRNSSSNPDIWRNKVSQYPQYNIKLHNLNFNTNGWKHVDESLDDGSDGEMMLKFTGDSYGEFINSTTNTRINPLQDFNEGSEGYALECVFRTRCTGELDYRVLTCQNGIDLKTPGFSISHEKMIIASNSQSTDLGFAEDEWIDAMFVIDKKVRQLSDVGLFKIENMNPTYSMRIYINGVLCSYTTFRSDKFQDSLGNAYPLLLNTALYQGLPSYFGECEIKSLKLYNSYLTSEQVLQNYIASEYDLVKQKALKDRNDLNKGTLPIITFKRKPTANSNFTILNSITEKSQSKSTCVDCVVEIKYPDGTVTVWDNVDVYLQGTSSLVYPVKNYKLKLFSDDIHKSKKKVVMQDGWEPENTFTLKCDYMEASHLNNTPTARFFNNLIDVLGGKSPAKNNGHRDAIDGFPVIVYFTDDETDDSKLTLVGSYMFNIDKSGNTLGFKDTVKEDGQEINRCQSFEGVSNSSDSAGCFYKMEEAIINIYAYYIEECYDEAYLKYLNDNGLTSDKLTMEQFKETPEGKAVTYKTFDEFKEDYDDYDFLTESYEFRYDYSEFEDKENPTQEDYDLAYGALKEMVYGVADAVKNGTFREYHEEHFDYVYSATYYLNMMVFGQVDNPGKNCMWDTWDGKKWYTRPYDMDSQVGLSNTGTETIDVDCEINRVLSPTSASGTFAASTTNELTELRYASYNTVTSRFWNTFGAEYSAELKKTYQSLRQNVYTVDNIMNFFCSSSTDLIGEIYYNKDMSAKFLTQITYENTEYTKTLHGNRIQRFKQWITQRLNFLDTLFEYRKSNDNLNSENGTISLRSDAYLNTGNSSEATDDNSTLKAYIGLSSYTPQYVTISVDQGGDALITGYVGPKSTYIDPDTKLEMNGTLFTFPIKASDKNLTVSGSGLIRNINKIEDLNIRDLTITDATRLLSLNVQGSSRMTKLTLGNNKYLRELNCAGSTQLGLGIGGQKLDFTGCPNIQNVDVSNTKITAMDFPIGGSLKKLNASKSSIKNLYFKSLEFLNSIDITGCEDINEYIIDSCMSLNEVSLSGAPITLFKAINCSSLKLVDVSYCPVLETFEITNCPNIELLNMTNNNGSMMNDLHLYTLYNLKSLSVGNSTSLKNIRLPKYIDEDETKRIADIRATYPSRTDEELNAVLWNKLTTLNISSSSLISIQYGSTDIAESDRSCDFSQLENLGTISFYNCTSIKKIENLNYEASSINNLFYGCTNLTRISGKLKATSSASSAFSRCDYLTDIDDLVLDFTSVTTISSILLYSYRATYNMFKKILDSCSSKLQNINSAMYNCYMDTEMAVPANLFSNVPGITSASYALGSTKCTSLSKAVMDNLPNLQNAEYMFGSTKLTKVDQNVLYSLTKLTNCSKMFAYCPIVNFIDSNCNIFSTNKELININGMFSDCSKLLNTNGLSGMLDPLTKLQDASYLFYGCSAMTGSIPEGFFNKNTALRALNGTFAASGITGLPVRLFRKNESDTTEFYSLSLARSMFYNCTSLGTGYTVSKEFFAGVSNCLSNIGYINSDYKPNSSTRYELFGFFGNTKVQGFYEDFLSNLPLLTRADYLFYNDTALQYCYYMDGTTVKQYNNSLSPKLFDKNKSLQILNAAFYNCTGLRGYIPELFNNCKANIQEVYQMFRGCTNLNGSDLDSSTLKGISANLFSDCHSLRTVEQFMHDCSNYSGSIPATLFSGCTSLRNTHYMFYNCKSLNGAIPVELFNDCRNTLEYVHYMFYLCEGLDGKLPTGSITQKGFLADCINLRRADYLFYGCIGLTGAIPSDIFNTENLTIRFNYLTTIDYMFAYCSNLNEAYVDVDTEKKYICSPNLLGQLPAITSVRGLFRRTFIYNSSTNPTPPAIEIPQILFNKQILLENAAEVFYGITVLTGQVTGTLLYNSKGTLLNVYAMFAFTGINSLSTEFLHGTDKNNKLKYIGCLFYSCTSLKGTSPIFWDGNIFSTIVGDADGYYRALYGCSGLSNYSVANGISSNWTTNQPQILNI